MANRSIVCVAVFTLDALHLQGLATNILALQSLTVASFEQPLYLTIKALWRLPVIQEAYARRSEFQLLDCAKQ